MKTIDTTKRVQNIPNPQSQYYVILTYEIGTNNLLKVSVRQREDVNSYMKNLTNKYPVEFEFSGHQNTSNAYSYKDDVQRSRMHLRMTDRDRAKRFKGL